VARELSLLGMERAQVTLDGPRENHDRFRPFVSGKGSFDTIVGNLREACDHLVISIAGSFTQENYKDFPVLLDYLIGVGLTPDRIGTVAFSPVSKSGGDYLPPEYNDGCAFSNEPWVREALLFLRGEIQRRGFATVAVQPTCCMVELDDDLVVTHDGRFYKCPAMIVWKDMAVGDLWSGIQDYRESHRLDVWKKDECLDCAYLPLCLGGCRLARMLEKGVIDDIDCRREFFDASLEAFLRQDLEDRPHPSRPE